MSTVGCSVPCQKKGCQPTSRRSTGGPSHSLAFMHKVSPCSGCFLRIASAALTPAPDKCPFCWNVLCRSSWSKLGFTRRWLTIWYPFTKEIHNSKLRFVNIKKKLSFQKISLPSSAHQENLTPLRSLPEHLSCTAWSRRTSRWTERRPVPSHFSRFSEVSY